MTAVSTKIQSSFPKAISLGKLAELTGATVVGSGDVLITGVGSIEAAKPGEITYINEAKYLKLLAQTSASAVIVSKQDETMTPPCALLIAKDPRFVFAKILEILFPEKQVKAGIHPTAIVGQGCDIHPDAYVGPHCVIEDNVKIAQGAVLIAQCFVGDNVVIGEGTVIHPHATIYHDCVVGNQCVIHSGAVIGSDGFGFVKQRESWVKVPQIGKVTIGDRCEIGSNTTIDRGAIEDTEIASDVILDNLNHIAHNVKIGQGTAMAACSGVAGSTTIGKHCMIGGRTGIVGHINITDYVNIIASSNVGQAVTKPGVYGSGLTITDMRTWKRNLVRFHQLDQLATRLFELERKLKVEEESVRDSGE